jgi:hypothetical protein
MGFKIIIAENYRSAGPIVCLPGTKRETAVDHLPTAVDLPNPDCLEIVGHIHTINKYTHGRFDAYVVTAITEASDILILPGGCLNRSHAERGQVNLKITGNYR